MHFERLKYRGHLLLRERFVDELLEKLAQLIQFDAIASFDDLAREELPLLLWHLLGDLIEKVHR